MVRNGRVEGVAVVEQRGTVAKTRMLTGAGAKSGTGYGIGIEFGTDGISLRLGACPIYGNVGQIGQEMIELARPTGNETALTYANAPKFAEEHMQKPSRRASLRA